MQTYNIDTDAYDNNKVNRFIDAKTLKELSQIKTYRGLLQIALEWVGIAIAIVACSQYWNPILYVIVVTWIGARQNALAAIMHDVAHYRLLKNRKWNNWVGELFTAWPLLVTVEGYRQTHFAHHRYVNKPEDPDWQRKQSPLFSYPKSPKELVFITLKYLLGYYAFMELFGINQEAKISSKTQWTRLSLYGAIITASILFHFWFGLLIYWVVPLLTYFLWLIYLRGVAEHFGGIENNEDLLGKTRVIKANLLERLWIAPNNINIHLPHHIYPSVPFYNLDKLQKLLMQNPDYVKRAHVTNGYLAFLKEWMGRMPAPSVKTSITAYTVSASLVKLATLPRWRKLISDDTILLNRAFIRFSKDSWLKRLIYQMPTGAYLWVMDAAFIPGLSYHYLFRKLFIENKLHKAIKENVTQVVVLGAGFDTLAIRMAKQYDQVNFYEIDLPNTQNIKQSILEHIQYIVPSTCKFIEADLAQTRLETVLMNEATFDRLAPTIIILEGVLMYLSTTEVIKLFLSLNQLFKGSLAIMFGATVDSDENGTWWVRKINRFLGKNHEGMKWYCPSQDIADFVNSIGFELCETVFYKKLQSQYRQAKEIKELPEEDENYYFVQRV